VFYFYLLVADELFTGNILMQVATGFILLLLRRKKAGSVKTGAN
jgi:hypothetical protein